VGVVILGVLGAEVVTLEGVLGANVVVTVVGVELELLELEEELDSGDVAGAVAEEDELELEGVLGVNVVVTVVGVELELLELEEELDSRGNVGAVVEEDELELEGVLGANVVVTVVGVELELLELEEELELSKGGDRGTRTGEDELELEELLDVAAAVEAVVRLEELELFLEPKDTAAPNLLLMSPKLGKMLVEVLGGADAVIGVVVLEVVEVEGAVEEELELEEVLTELSSLSSSSRRPLLL